MATLPRIGNKEPRYNFFLNPYVDQRFTTCPVCDRPMRQRKLPLAVHLNGPKLPMVVNKTCRYCPDCDLLIAHRDQMDEIVSVVLGNEVSADDYLVIGTLDRDVWKRSMKSPMAVRETIDNLHDFEDMVSFEVRGGWMPNEEAKRLEREEKRTRAAWKKKIAAQRRNKK